MLLHRSIALDCLRRTFPPIDDQKLALLHAPFKGTTLFGGELAKLQEANTNRAATFTVFPQPTAPPASYSTRPYVGRGKSFTDRRGYKKSGGRGKGQGRSTPSATSTKPGQSKEGQATLTVSVPSDSKKRKVESQDNTPQTPRKAKHNKKNEGVLPPQLTPVGGRLSTFVEGWKRIANDPYVLSIVAKGTDFVLRVHPFYVKPPGRSDPPGARGNSRHAGTNHPHASKERDNRGASELPRILFKRIPGTKSFRRVA